MRIYIDACALNRLTDPAGQLRVDQESDAMEEIFLSIEEGKMSWIASALLVYELRRCTDIQRREDALGMLRFAAEVRSFNDSLAFRAKVLESIGYDSFDAFHLAFAEEAKVDLFLTTDDRFLRKIVRGLGNPVVRAANPLDWVRRRMP